MTSAATNTDPLDPLADELLARHRRGERPDVEEFAACHPELADRIRSLFPALLALEAAGEASPSDTLSTGARLGEYRLVREVGRGGMGVVYEAVQETLGRRVALKVLAAGAHDPSERLDRFRREARTAGRLHHTNIVPVYGVGADRGTHFYAMQYIRGRSLADVLADVRRRRTGSTVVQAAGTGDASSTLPSASGATYFRRAGELIAQAADAVAHAHAQGVLHRDLKPSNLLVDDAGTLWVADFGLAKADDSDDLTRTGDLVGTLRYMAPERFRGEADGRSDVYALGATLYELLTLRPAFDAADRPHLIEQVTRAAAPPPRSVDSSIPLDLETIAQKAMAADPRERYQSAAAMAEDLRRYLDGRPVLARRPTLAQRGVKWARRNSALVAVTGVAAALAAVVSITVLAVSNAAIAAKQKDTEKALARESTALKAERLARGEAQERLRQSLIDQAAAVRLSRRPGQRLRSLALLREAAGIRASEELSHDVMASFLLTDWEEIEPVPAPSDQFAAHFFDYLDAVNSQSAVVRRKPGKDALETIPFDASAVRNFAVSPDGRYAFAFDKAHGLIWDRTARKVVLTTTSRPRQGNLVTWSADSAYFVAEETDRKIHVYDLKAGKQAAAWEPDSKRRPVTLALAPNNVELAMSLPEPSSVIRVCDLLTGRVVGDLPVVGVGLDLLWSRTGYWLAASSEGLVTLWRRSVLPNGPPQHHGAVVIGRRHAIRLNDFTPEDDLLLINSFPRTLILVAPDELAVVTDLTARSVPRLNIGNLGSIGLARPGCVFANDGRSIGWQGQIVSRVVRPAEVHRLSRAHVTGWNATISQDGRTCYITGGGKATTVSPWSLTDFRVGDSCDFPPGYQAFLPTTESLWAFDAAAGEVRLRQPRAGSPEAVFTRVPAGTKAAVTPTTFQYWPANGVVALRAYQPAQSRSTGLLVSEEDLQRTRVVRAGSMPGLHLWPPAEPAKARLLDLGIIDQFALDPIGRWIAAQSAGEDTIKVWEYPSGRLLQTLASTASDRLLFSPDGRFLAHYSRGGIALWRTDTWARIFEQSRLPMSRTSALAFSADSKLFAVGDKDDVVIRRTADAAVCLRWDSPGSLSSLAFSPDGRRLVGVAPPSVWAWDLALIRQQLREMNLDWSDDPPGP
ncbi:MAG: WD40 repeat domain-containing serine/threonine protein kinase [Gemmataceae bacterium]